MLKNDLNSKMLRRLILTLGIIGPLLLANGLFQYFLLHNLSFLVLSLIYILMFGCITALLWYFYRRIDKRRVLALQRDPQMLAAQQPVPNAQALPLPATIELHVPAKFLLIFALVEIAGIIILLLAVFFFLPGLLTLLLPPVHGKHLSLTGLVIFVGIFMGVVFITLAIMLVFMQKRAKYIFHVTEQGISSTYNKITTYLDWDDASLFTVITVKKRGRPKTYELSNDDTAVRWMWIPRHPFFFFPFRPTVPYDEYERQMQGLLEFAEARTHLPLYDVSEPKAKWWM